MHVSGRAESQAGVVRNRAKPFPMTEHVASRTLVKSPPELWAECSDAASLARHLDGFGEIRITKLDPETAVAWEGERARGTVRIEPSGWGTKVILTAVAPGAEVAEASEVTVAAGPVVETEPAAPGEPETVTETETEPETEPETVSESETESESETVSESESETVSESETEPEPLPKPAAPGEPETVPEPETPPGPETLPGPEEVVAVEGATDHPAARRRRFARLFAFFRGPEPVVAEAVEREPTPEPEREAPPVLDAPDPELESEPALAARPEPGPQAAPPPTDIPATEAALAAALDSLGQAHHRPYSRA